MLKKSISILFVLLGGAINADTSFELNSDKFRQIEKLLNKQQLKEAYSRIKTLELSIPKNSHLSISNINYLKGYYYYITNDFNKCIKYGEDFINKAEDLNKIEHKRILVDAYQHTAHCYEYKGEYDVAKKTYNQSLSYSIRENYKRGMGISHSGIGSLQYYLGKPFEGFRNLSTAFNLIQSSSDEENNYYELSSIISSIGNIYYSIGEFELAIERYKEALYLSSFDDEYNYATDSAVSYFNISHSYMKLEKHNEAKDYLDKLELTLESTDDKLFKSTSQLLRVVMMIKDENFDSAEEILNDIIPVFVEYDDYVNKDSANLQLVKVRVSQKRYNEALNLTLESYNSNSEKNDFKGKMDSLLAMSNILEKMDRYKESYEHYIEYKELYMNKNNDNLSKLIGELSVKFEAKRTENENNKLITQSIEQTEHIVNKDKIIFIQKNIIKFSIIVLSIILIILAGIVFLTKTYNRIARYDLLTQIYNRRHIFHVGETIHNKKNTYCSVIMDIDHFKNVNDTYGHSAGDLVLQQFTSRVLSVIRKTDVIGRYGGEEFVVILDNTFKKEGIEITERIRQCINDSDFFINNDIAIKVTSSFGITESTGYQNFDKTLVESDKLLYKAKNLGRNCVVS